MDQNHQQVRPHLASDPPGRNREPVPRYDAMRRLWHRLRLAHGLKPAVGAVLIGGAVVAIAMQTGVGEFAVGALASYTAYRMLRYGIDLRQALLETVELEKVVERW